MKATHKIVAGLAIAGLTVTAAIASRPMPHKVVKNAIDPTAGVAATAAGLNYATGFESTDSPSYSTGYINNGAGVFPAGCGGVAAPCWGHTAAANASLITPTIAAVHPFAGTQHLRLTFDTTTRTNITGFNLGVDARFPRTADLSVRPVAANTASVMVSIDTPFGQDYRIQPQSNSQGFLATSALFFYAGGIYVLDDVCGATGLNFISTGFFWDTLGGYQNYTVAMDPCGNVINYNYGGQLIYSSCTYAGTNLEQFLVFGDNYPGSTMDIDDLSLSSAEDCPSLCGNGIVEAPNENCEPGNVPTGCGPGHACGDVGTAGACQCNRICTLAEPCVLHNGTNGPFVGPFDQAYGGIFVYDAPAGVDAVSVELCGSTGVDTNIQYWGSCSDPGDAGSSNDDCCDPSDPNCGTFGAGSDPSASCYNNVGAPNYESCTCHDNPLAGDSCYLLQTNGGNSSTATFTIEINKKATCGGGHLGACCDTNGADTGCTDNVLAGACVGADKVWTENGKCASIQCACIPDCSGGRNCGDDGCGGSCGTCGDNVACNGVETCDQTGHCVAGTPVNCDDSIACTVDACNEPDGTCSHTPNNNQCSDGNVCNGIETCNAATGCVGGTALVCDDGIFCNGAEGCDPQAGCVPGSDPCPDPDTHCDEAGDTCAPNSIPTVSEWGLVVLTLMLLIGAKVYFGRRQAVA